MTFRTLDVGGDKPLRLLSACPRSATRCSVGAASALCLDWPDILYTQLRAILQGQRARGTRASLLPMVTTRSEVVRCREVLGSADGRSCGRTSVSYDAHIELGVMVEVPILVEVLPEVLPVVDFVSVGTNDLVQYLLAVDRDNQRVAKMYDPFHPGRAAGAGRKSPTMATQRAASNASICGEIAGDHCFTPLLVGLGYRELSMAPVFLPRVKLMLRRVSTSTECRDLAQPRPGDALDQARSAKLVQRRDPAAVGPAARRAPAKATATTAEMLDEPSTAAARQLVGPGARAPACCCCRSAASSRPPGCCAARVQSVQKKALEILRVPPRRGDWTDSDDLASSARPGERSSRASSDRCWAGATVEVRRASWRSCATRMRFRALDARPS